MMNYNNLAQKTNFIAGSDKFKAVPFLLTAVNVPGINFSHPEIGGRDSVRMKLNADTIRFNTLSFDMLIDEDYEIYLEFMDVVNKHINVEKGTYRDFYFDFWIQINNSKANKLFKIDFSNCRLESISDFFLETGAETTEHKLSVELTFDYYTLDRGLNIC
jgi:hypothetical protein